MQQFLINHANAGSKEKPIDLELLTKTYSDVFSMWSVVHLRLILAMQPDFQAQKSRLAELIEDERGHMCRFLPKFHCELNIIELYWCITKMRTRRRAVMTWAGLKEGMWNAFGKPDCLDLDGDYRDDKQGGCITPLYRQRAARKVREFFKLYLVYDGKDISTQRSLMKLARGKLQKRVAPRL